MTFFRSKIIFFLFLIMLLIFGACNSPKLSETPLSQFEGIWELEGRSIFEGIQIKIYSEKKSEHIIGKITKINSNKYVEMFVDSGDTWISEISRKSNYQFELTEKKIGSQLFSLYGQSTSTNFNVQFIDKSTFGLSPNNLDPEKSTIVYKRVKN